MKQRGDEHWSGHREITRGAVDRLFQDLVSRVGDSLQCAAPRHAPRGVGETATMKPASRPFLRLAMHAPGHRTLSSNHRHGTLAGPDGRIRGLSRPEYFEALDGGQAAQDRAFSAGVVKNFANTGLSFPYVGPGPTMHSAYANPNVQANHFMADPYRRGGDNLRTNVEYIFDELREARSAGDEEFRHLGAAAHALQWRRTSSAG